MKTTLQLLIHVTDAAWINSLTHTTVVKPATDIPRRLAARINSLTLLLIASVAMTHTIDLQLVVLTKHDDAL